jgi:hypothetical protein
MSLQTIVTQAWNEVEVRDRVLTVLGQHNQVHRKAKKALRLCSRAGGTLQLPAFGTFHDEADVTVSLFIAAQGDCEQFRRQYVKLEKSLDDFLHTRKARR